MALGERQQVTWRGFRGLDIHRSSIFPEVPVPQELISNGLLLDARNLRFSAGRAYWHRNQLKVHGPATMGTPSISSVVTGGVRSSNVVTITTATAHGLVTGNNVHIFGVQDSSFDGTFAVASTPDATSFTYAQTAANATSTGGTASPCWPTALVEYASTTGNQLLAFLDDGTLHYLNTGWSGTPTQWEYGYELFSGSSWVNVASSLPTAPAWGFANMKDYLIVASGVSTGFGEGMATKYYDGVNLTDIGFATPLTAPTLASHTGAGDELRAGRYSYKVVVGNTYFESMPGPLVDIDVAEVKATATITPYTTETPDDGDTITINGVEYTFEATPDAGVGPHVVFISPAGNAVTYSHLARLINGGREYSAGAFGLRVSDYTDAHPDVTASYALVNSVPTITLTAIATGVDGNSVTLAESTSGARITVSGSTLGGGVTYHHVDLSSVPIGPSGATFRKLYRAFTTDTTPGVRGENYQYLATINDNTTTTYADNTPQEELGEPIAFDHACPPRGDHMVFHRDRLWMAGAARTSESYKTVASITAAPSGATWAANVATITTSAAHGLIVGDRVTIAGVDDSSYDGARTVTSVPSTTSFTYALSSVSDTTSGGGTVTSGIYTTGLQNILFFSELDEPFYWPAANQITVGGSAPIVGLVTWHDQLLILKTDSAWLLTGYYTDDYRLTQIPGVSGAIGPHVASGPYGVVWAGHQGWIHWTGETANCIVEYQEDSAYDVGTLQPPRIATGGAAKFPAICYHAGRYHIWGGDYTYSWKAESDTWEIARRDCAQVGCRAYEYSISQSHILAWMHWGDVTGNDHYITILDDQYRVDNEPYGRYNDSKGTGDDGHYGEVRVELPPIVAPPGERLCPLELWVFGQWTEPTLTTDRLKLYIFDESTLTWGAVGVVTPNGRLGIPARYAKQRLRLCLQGNEVPYFALHGVTLIYQRRAARGN